MPKEFLKLEERQQLSDIVSQLYDFTDGGVRGRRVFIQETAGLGRFISGINLDGNPRTVASDLVGRLERFGYLPELPTYHSLGALLAAMLNLDDLSNEDKAFVAGLVVRYSLIADLNYLENLRHQYNITDETILSVPSEVALPRIETAPKINSPQFEAQIDDESALERIINSEDNFLDIYLLYGALYCSQAVGMIEVPEGNFQGTGFLVSPDLLLTNSHVLEGKEYLDDAVVRFGRVVDANNIVSSGKVVQILSDFYFSSPPDQLDYALVRLKDKPLEKFATKGEMTTNSIDELFRIGKHRGYLTLAPRTFPKHSRVNIIQHPDGQPLKVVMTQNYVVHTTDTRVQYVADTMNGSSGSPVFNHNWEVVALHHSGAPYPPETLAATAKKVWKGRYRVNEGIPMREILKDFKNQGIIRYLPRK